MPLSETLARVDADLAAGRVPVARQRLRGLVSSFPYDLTLRRRLAEVYRLYGDAAEAGRWMYLEEDREADETAAFEARYGSPGWRMKALAWHGPETKAPPPSRGRSWSRCGPPAPRSWGTPSTGTTPPPTGTSLEEE